MIIWVCVLKFFELNRPFFNVYNNFLIKEVSIIMFKTSNMKFGSFTNNSSATTSSEKPSTTIPANNKNSSSKDNHKINSNDFVPKRFGLKFDPPTISNYYSTE